MQVVKFFLMFVACAAAGIALVAIADLSWSFFGGWMVVPVAAVCWYQLSTTHRG